MLAFVVDKNGILVRTSDKGNQIVAWHSVKERILYINHHSKLAGQPDGRKIYHRIRKTLRSSVQSANATKSWKTRI